MAWKAGFLLFWIGIVGCATGSDQKGRTLTDQDRAQMYLNSGNAALLEGDATVALQNLMRAESWDRQIPELHHSKAIAYYRKHDPESAILSVRKALQLSPDFSDAKNTLGRLLIDSGKYDEAVIPLTEAARDPLYRDSYKSWTNLGILKYQQGKLNEAAVYMEHAILDAPEKACIAYFYRGQIQEKEKKLMEAIDSYRRASQRLCASYVDAQFALGLAYGKSRNFNVARKVFLDINNRFPNSKFAEQAMSQLRFLP